MADNENTNVDTEQIAKDMLHYANQDGVSYRTAAIARLNAVPVEALQGLVEEWRELAEKHEKSGYDGSLERAGGIGGCAQELQFEIDSYTDE